MQPNVKLKNGLKYCNWFTIINTFFRRISFKSYKIDHKVQYKIPSCVSPQHDIMISKQSQHFCISQHLYLARLPHFLVKKGDSIKSIPE